MCSAQERGAESAAGIAGCSFSIARSRGGCRAGGGCQGMSSRREPLWSAVSLVCGTAIPGNGL